MFSLDDIPATSISISPLGSSTSSEALNQISLPLNASALIEFNRQLNSQANAREYLLKFTQNLAITTWNSIQIQSSSLAKLTEQTNELTRTTLVRDNVCI